MLATVQRVSQASVIIDNAEYSSIREGILVFICIEQQDCLETSKEMAHKIFNFKMLDGSKGITSLSLKNSDEEILIISQFTLAAITNKGNKPSFHKAAPPEKAKEVYEEFVNIFKESASNVKTGKFGEIMDISLINNGPVTFNFRI